MYKPALRGILALSVLLAAGMLPADEPVTLRYQISENEALAYRTVTGVKQTQKVANQEIVTEMTNTDVSVRTLQKIDDEGNFHLQTENKRLKAEVNIGPLGKYEFDSEATERDTASVLGSQVGPFYDRLSGAILNLTVSPRGEVVKLEGYEELLGDLLKQYPLAAQFAGGGSDDAAKMSMAEQFVLLSEEAVEPGDTWEQTYQIELPKIGTIEGKRIYKYIGREKVGEAATAKISETTQLEFDLDVNTGQAQVTGRMSVGDSSGVIQFDPENGRLISRESSYTLSGDLMVTAGGNTLPVQTSQTQRVKIELLDELPE